MHAVIHGLVLALFILPTQILSVLIILAIAVTHGMIDIIKIKHQKHGVAFAPDFLLDQIAHLMVLFAATPLLASVQFWSTPTGIGITLLLFSMSFGIGLWNIVAVWQKKYFAKTGASTECALVVALVFLIYFMAAQLIAL